MPELPEVETVRRGLSAVEGREVTSAWVGRDRVVRRTSSSALIAGVEGRRIERVSRRGKYLLLDLGGEHRLMVHLRMSGQVFIVDEDVPLVRHTHVRLGLDDGREVRFVDPRTFGEVVPYTLSDASAIIPELDRLGPDPLVDGVTVDDLITAFRGRRRRLKDSLLDQRVIAGIGNIYGDEICHRARLSPMRAVGSIPRSRLVDVAHSITTVLAAAVAAGGSTLGDAQYVSVDGEAGSFQHQHRVYGRAGQRCVTCDRGIIRRTIVAQRSTHHCPVCQR